MSHAINDEALDRLFRNARTFRKFKPDPVRPQMLMAIYDLVRMGPTSVNGNPARILFLVSKEAKERVKPYLTPGNVAQTMAAPVTALIGYDLHFYEFLPKLATHKPELAEQTRNMEPDKRALIALRSGTLQAGYFIMAARAIGLVCGPMEGFDHEGADKEFFPEGHVKSNILCNLGYGEEPAMRPRAARLSFDEACRIL